MSDQFPPGQNSAKADFEVSPESGPGEGAANWHPDTSLGGGGGPEEPPSQEGENATTRASRSFLERTSRNLKRTWPFGVAVVTIGALTVMDAPLAAKGIIAAVGLAPMGVKYVKERLSQGQEHE